MVRPIAAGKSSIKAIERNRKIAVRPKSSQPDEKLSDALANFYKDLGPICEKAFATYEDAFNYAKKTVVRALQGNKPHEYSVVIDSKGRVIIESKGTKTECEIPLFFLTRDSVILHGHPARDTGESTPVSLVDLFLLNKSKAKKIIALNKNGEYSALEKKADFKVLSKKQISELKRNYYKEVFGLDYDTFLQKRKGRNLTRSGSTKKLAIQLPEDGIKRLHNFLVKYADEFGFRYETNYSNID